MIDWDALGPANSPTPVTPNTTAPVAPATPGSLPSFTGAPPAGPTPASAAFKDSIGNQYQEGSQADIDSLNPLDRVHRGLDALGNGLFGQGNGSLLGGIPGADLAKGAIGGVGDAVGSLVDWNVVKPIEAGATILSSIPLGWLPGGADDAFRQYGEWAKVNNPEVYAEWQLVDAAAGADVLGGGNLRANFNLELTKFLDDQQRNSQFGAVPIELAMGREAVGSLGGGLSHAIQGWLGVTGNATQRWLGEQGVFDPSGSAIPAGSPLARTWEDAKASGISQSEDGAYALKQLAEGKFTEAEAKAYYEANVFAGRNRVEEAMARLDRGAEVSDVERQAVEAVRSGAWSMDHGQDFIIQRGQSVTRNLIGQIIGSLGTDPLTYATVGAGAVSKAGNVGKQIAQAGAQASTMYERLALTVATVQGSELGPAFRIARGLIDPLAVYQPSTVARATTDLMSAVSVDSFGRAYGPAVGELRAIAREFGKVDEIDSAIASYAMDQANLMIARKAQRAMLEQGVGEELVHTSVDDVIRPLAAQAGRDAVTELTDHIMLVAKNTFTPEEEASLAGRMAATFGNDAPFWQKRIAGMSHELKSSLHAVTYKRAEVEFEQARAMLDTANYTGDLPLRNMVLMTTDTLDDVRAQAVIDNIRDVLKNAPEDEAKIAMATAEWNLQSRRFPAMANIGYAPGGKTQLEGLVNELERKLQSGGLSRRATPEELNDPAMKPIRDMLDRNSFPGAELTPEEQASRAVVARRDAEAAVAKAGFKTVSNEKFFAAIRKAAAVTKTNGRKVGETVYVYPKGDYRKMRLFLHEDGKTGFAIKEDGDLVSVFSVSDEKGRVSGIVEQFRGLGATKLDAFDEDGRLPLLYNKGGFRETGRDAWDPQYAPDGWAGAEPDVVYMTADDLPTSGTRRLWNVGFRPDEEVAWGLKRDFNTGRYIVDRDPTISHIVDAVPGRQPFSDTTRNVLGQIIGKSKAERLNKPIDSIEAFTNTMTDVISGRRLVGNIERRFERTTFDAGIPKPISKEIFRIAREVAGLDYSTVRGVRPTNLWNEIAEIIPRDLVLKDGTRPNIHIIMEHLLTAAEGDLRIMGLTSVLSQRMRNALRRSGLDPANWAGQMTVTMYNKLRYSQPMFLIQRITDAPYYSILYGVKPIGKAPLTGANAELEKIAGNLGVTGMARDFSMDMPEYAVRSNFTAGIKSAMADLGLKESRLDRILRTPDDIIANNMTNMLHARLGDIVKGSLDNLAEVAEKGDPALKAEMLAAGEQLQNTFEDWRRVYSQNAGRVLDDNEVGLQYIKDQLTAWRRHVVNEDGTLDFEGHITDGARWTPDDIGAIEPIRPDILAERLGYPDAATMRRDVTGSLQKVNGEFQLVKGESDIAAMAEKIRVNLNADPGYIRRAEAYFSETWDDFWRRLELPSDQGGLDISPHYAKEAQDLIAITARGRGMDPWEYLSGVMATNIGATDLETHMGQLMAFLKAGKSKQPLEEWTKMFRATLDPSAQRKLIEEFENTLGVEGYEALVKSPKPAAWGAKPVKTAPGKPARPPVTDVPAGYKAEKGYIYRIETVNKARGGWPKGVDATDDAARHLYIVGKSSEAEGVFRVKMDPSELAPGRTKHAADHLTKRAVPPEQIEMLDDTGNWVSLGEDPMTRIMAKDFPEAVRQRIISGVPHPDPEIEGYMQALSKWVQDAIGSDLGAQTRSDLRRLVEAVPTTHATSFNRSQALIVSLLKQKIEDAQQDIFRLAEMQTKRSVLERSLNHPLFGLYPASYMWGKVLPETVKFLAKNPYGATYGILNVQNSIAIQREYDPELDEKVNTVDRSSGAFLLDYLTPGLPWSTHEARMSPLLRNVTQGTFDQIWPDELSTVSPNRWISSVSESLGEIPGAIESLQEPTSPGLQKLQDFTSGGGTQGGDGTGDNDSISGPTKAAALAPLLQEGLSRLQSILIEGKDAGDE